MVCLSIETEQEYVNMLQNNQDFKFIVQTVLFKLQGDRKVMQPILKNSLMAAIQLD